MKKLLIAFAVIFGIAVVVLAALPLVLTGDFVAERLAASVKEHTGRDLRIRIASLSVFPRLKATVESAALSDVPGAERPPMIELGPAELEMPLWPLLRGTVDVQRVRIDGLRANLRVAADGRSNWDFGRAGETRGDGAAPSASPEPASPEPASQEPASHGPPSLPDIRLGDVRLSGAAVTYTDERSGQSLRVSDGVVAVAMPDLDTPAHVDGNATVNDRAIVVKAVVASPRALAEQRPTAVQGRITSDLFNAQLDAKPEAGGHTGGPLSVAIPDLHATAAWLGVPNAQTLPVRNVSLTGTANLGGPRFELDAFKLALDEVKGNGSVKADWSGRVPVVTLRASVNPVNLDRFLPPPAPAQGSSSGSPAAEWSDKPIDLTALRSANLDAVIASQGLQIRNVQLGPSQTTVHLWDGVLAIDAPDVPAFGGQTSTALRIDAARQPANYTLKTLSNGIRAEQVLAGLAGTDLLRGAALFDVDVATTGSSQKALVSGLNGTTRIVFRDGALRGINIAAILRDPVAAATGQQQNVARETDFAEFGGNFHLERGVARTTDLRMLAPLFRVEGEGTVSLPDRRLDLRLTPTATASLKGQGGPLDKTGVAIPVLVTGPFNAPSIQPDFSGVALSAIKDPAKAADAVRRLREGASPADILGGLVGSGGSGNQASPSGQSNSGQSNSGQSNSGQSNAPSETTPLGNLPKGLPPLQKGPLEQGLKGIFGR